jgi:hypothetical protein
MQFIRLDCHVSTVIIELIYCDHDHVLSRIWPTYSRHILAITLLYSSHPQFDSSSSPSSIFTQDIMSDQDSKPALLRQIDHPPYRIPHQSLPGLPQRPNMIIFMPDQLRYDSLSATNPSSPIRTPNLDAFAARGARFTNCFVQASVCAQSRCSMFTGLYPHVSGHRSLENLIKAHEPNLFRSLKEEGGYHVACLAPRGDTFAPAVTELSVSEYGFLEGPGWTPRFGGGGGGGGKQPEDKEGIWGRLFYKGLRNAGEEADYDDAVIRSALKWLERPPKDKPWCLFLPLLFPHCPFQVEEPWFSMYDRGEMPPPSKAEDKVSFPRFPGSCCGWCEARIGWLN